MVMAVRKTKRGIDEWMETIDRIYNDEELRSEFTRIVKEKRDKIYYWACSKGFKHWMILRLAKEYSMFMHYESMRTEYFQEYYDEEKKFESNAPSEHKFLGAYILKQEVKQMFFMED